MKTTVCRCAYCKNDFKKLTSEWKRSEKREKRHFCGLGCSVKWKNVNLPNPGNPEVLIANNRRDEFTPFRWFMRRAMSRKNAKNKRSFQKKEVDITLEYLVSLWENQEGICPISGVQMTLPYSSETFASDDEIWKRASLDRIDNEYGYIKENVRYVCWMANVGRGALEDEDLIEFCRHVAQNNPAPK